jgi:hypothetical protein
MKKLFTYKKITVSLVKGFVFGIGFDREYVLFIGPIVFELDIEPRKLKNQL